MTKPPLEAPEDIAIYELHIRDFSADGTYKAFTEPASDGMRHLAALAEAGLIDEYELVVHPRVAGHGPRLLEGLSKHVELELVGTLELSSGAVALRYAPKRDVGRSLTQDRQREAEKESRPGQGDRGDRKS